MDKERLGRIVYYGVVVGIFGSWLIWLNFFKEEEPSMPATASVPAEGSPPAKTSTGVAYDRGHRAGYDWAERKGVDLEDDCENASESFTAGCIDYVQEHLDEGHDAEPESEPIPRDY